jgi:steroid 5-alpha reductase family enzyme
LWSVSRHPKYVFSSVSSFLLISYFTPPPSAYSPHLTSLRRSPQLREGKLINSYLGEVLLQFGPPILSTAVAPPQWKYIGFVSPLFTYLLLRYASGVPPLEKSAEQKWSNEEDWGRYRDSTGVLIPGVGKGKVA